jgi:hypothetical protein
MVNLPIFKTIEILKKETNSIINVKFENASILLTGNYLIIIEKKNYGNDESSINTVFNLSEIKSYKTK